MHRLALLAAVLSFTAAAQDFRPRRSHDERPSRQRVERNRLGQHDFPALLATVHQASFSSDKLAVVELAAQHGRFHAHEVGQLVDAFSFSSDKLRALTLLAPTLIDRENGFQLLNHFSFSSDRTRAAALLR